LETVSNTFQTLSVSNMSLAQRFPTKHWANSRNNDDDVRNIVIRNIGRTRNLPGAEFTLSFAARRASAKTVRKVAGSSGKTAFGGQEEQGRHRMAVSGSYVIFIFILVGVVGSVGDGV